MCFRGSGLLLVYHIGVAQYLQASVCSVPLVAFVSRACMRPADLFSASTAHLSPFAAPDSFQDHYDLTESRFCGTSGGSIVAGLLAAGVPMKQVVMPFLCPALNP